MPTRVLREGILSSPRINALSPLAELFYRRLMTVADDYGRYYASPGTLRGSCWPTCPEKVTEKQISGWLEECLSGENPLIIRYESGGNQYLQVQNFGQQTRSKSKFPEPSENRMLSNCTSPDNQLLSTCIAGDNHLLSLVGVVVEDEGVFDKRKTKAARKHRISEKSLPEDWHEWAAAKYSWDRSRSVRTFDKFLNYWQSKGELRADWKASWRTWVMNDEERNPSRKMNDPELLDHRNQPWKPDWR